MKNNKKLRVFQIYLHTSNYDIKERMKTHAIIKEHINQARNRHYQIIIMGDFNVNPDKLRLNETKYKRQYDIIQYLNNLSFFDIFDTIYDINDNNPQYTWFNSAKQLKSRIDMIWISNNSIDNLIYCDSVHKEFYNSDHKLLICFLDKNNLLNDKSHAQLKKQDITKTIYSYDKMNNEAWKQYADYTDELLHQIPQIKKYKENYQFNTKDLNSLWQYIRDIIIKAAKKHIPNHQSSTQQRCLISQKLSSIYKDISKLNKIYHKFHHKHLRLHSYVTQDIWQQYCTIIFEVANNNNYDKPNLPLSINDSEQVKTETIKHFQTIANSTHHPISNEDENWKLWQDEYHSQNHISSDIYRNLMNPPTLKEWINIINQLPNDKAPGTSGITNEMLKHIGPATQHYLWFLVKACLKWRLAYIYPIPKPKE